MDKWQKTEYRVVILSEDRFGLVRGSEFPLPEGGFAKVIAEFYDRKNAALVVNGLNMLDAILEERHYKKLAEEKKAAKAAGGGAAGDGE